MSEEAEQMLKEAKECAGRLTAARPHSVCATAFSKKWKLPFKAAMIRELFLYRTVDLASASIAHFEQKSVVPAAILTRSVVESFAALFALHEQLERFLKNDAKDIDELDRFLMCFLVGSRNNPDAEMPKSVNVLTMIDKVEKTTPGFRFHYDALSEYAHPNWAGTFGSYGQTVKNPPELKLGPNVENTAYTAGLAVLSITLVMFEHFYEWTGQMIRNVNDYFATGE
jgi:hypothetical protein